jgi:hypothetical protein
MTYWSERRKDWIYSYVGNRDGSSILLVKSIEDNESLEFLDPSAAGDEGPLPQHHSDPNPIWEHRRLT